MEGRGEAVQLKPQRSSRGDQGRGTGTWGWLCAALTSFRYYMLSENSQAYFDIMEIDKVNRSP